MESVITKEDEIKWNDIVSKYKIVDYKKLEENEDDTSIMETTACGGNKCEIF